MAVLHAPLKPVVARAGNSFMVAIDCSCGEYAGPWVETRPMAVELFERHVKLAEAGVNGAAIDLGAIQGGNA